MIILENVSKHVISNMTLHIPQGECVGVIGASGAGKTTLLKLMSGLLEAQEGYVRTLGKNPVLQKGNYGRDVSIFMIGKSNLVMEDSVRLNLEILGKVYRMPRKEFEEEYEMLSNRLGFDIYEDEKIVSLSLGQRMRVELGAALLMKPKLLLLDEPDVGLDERGKNVLWQILDEKQKKGMTTVVSSHHLVELAKHCRRIALIDQGQLLFWGTEKRLRSHFASIDRMIVKITGTLPDVEDLPLVSYEINGNFLYLYYDSNHLSAAEIIGLLLRQTQIDELVIKKTELSDIIMLLRQGGKENEFD